MTWEQRLAAHWAALDALDATAFLGGIDTLVSELPADSAEGAFERAAAQDSTGHPERAVPLYRTALQRGLQGVRRRRAVIQLASSLRALGHADESVALLRAERDRAVDPSDIEAGAVEALGDAVVAVLALALVDTGRPREAASLAVGALARHLPRYQRSMAAYARAITGD